MTRCECPADTLGKFWRLMYPDRPGLVYHVACGRVRLVSRQPRPLTVAKV